MKIIFSFTINNEAILIILIAIIMSEQQDTLKKQIQRRSNSFRQDPNLVLDNEIPAHQQIFKDRLFPHIPNVKTKSYKENLFKIIASLSQLDQFTNNLQSKVDCLLYEQQKQFVNSYKLHMNKIRNEFNKQNEVIQLLQQQIKYYESQGKMSQLVRKVHKLEQESAELYKTLKIKDNRMKNLELQNRILSKELAQVNQDNKKYIYQFYESNKLNQRINTEGDILIANQDIALNGKSKNIQTFTTEIITKDLKQSDSLDLHKPIRTYKQYSKSIQSKPSPTLPQSPLPYSMSASHNLESQLKRLKHKNKKLVSLSTKAIDIKGEMQQFFITCVEQLKREIRIRKKMQFCTFQEFKKQDKLSLMIKILSSDQILGYLHTRLFNKRNLKPL